MMQKLSHDSQIIIRLSYELWCFSFDVSIRKCKNLLSESLENCLVDGKWLHKITSRILRLKYDGKY